MTSIPYSNLLMRSKDASSVSDYYPSVINKIIHISGITKKNKGKFF